MTRLQKWAAIATIVGTILTGLGIWLSRQTLDGTTSTSSVVSPPATEANDTTTTTPVPTMSTTSETSTVDPVSLPVPVELAKLPVVESFYTGYRATDDYEFVGFRTGVLDANGTPYSESLYHRGMKGKTEAFIDFNLGRKYEALSFTAAVAETAPEGAEFRFQVLVDGRGEPAVDVTYNAPLDYGPVDVSNALRLRIKIVRLDDGDTRAVAGFGSALITQK